MGKFFVDGKETDGPEDWKVLHPERHWKTGYSAKALAYSWETANGFPGEIEEVFGGSQFSEAELLIGFPEYRTPLPGRGRSSQTDLFVLAKVSGGLMTVAVEGKVGEDFGPTVWEWNPEGSRNRQTRIRGISDLLGLPLDSVSNLRYQLLHRTAAALIEAERFNARYAVMLVHSFSQEDEHFDDYQAFLKLLGVSGRVNSVTYAGNKGGTDLYLAWVRGDARFLRV